MKLRLNPSILKTLLKVLIVIALVAACVYLFPTHKSAFKYHYEVGKPWGYELLTAKKDFPIYKSQAQLRQEYDEVLTDYAPCYELDTAVFSDQLKAVTEMLYSAKANDATLQYVTKGMHQIYSQGIFRVDDYEKLQKDKRQKITVLTTQHVGIVHNLTDCYTPKTAYAKLVDEAPKSVKKHLHGINLNVYLQPNLVFEPQTSQKIYDQFINSVALTQGVVPAGVRIVDKGEIVTEETSQILDSMRIFYDSQRTDERQSVYSLIGDILLISCFVGLLLLYLIIFRPMLFDNTRTVLFLSLLIFIMVALASVTIRYTKFSIYLVPFAWVPIIVRVFYDSRTAFVVHLITILIVALIVPIPFEFMVVQLVIGLVAVATLKDMTQRAQLAQTAAWIWLAYVLTYTIFTVAVTGDFLMLNWHNYFYFFLNALFIIFAYGLIFLCEKAFGFVSSITLVELTNINSSLMLEFAAKAPGTFQHSLQVSTLATQAAKKIGAQTLLVRTGALYHDIGKMANPLYFTENQIDGANPLKELPYEQAAQIVIGHVEEGVRLAKKHNLPTTIINFIQTHHGTSKVRYFYNSYVNEHPNEKVDESKFTYPGPIPFSKEMAILMMADAIEARSRSLDVYTEESISCMVEQMIGTQIADGQFRNTSLSFKDVEEIKAVFKEKLISMNHHRIAYPELKQENPAQA